jgi:hypothetical protein
MNMQLNVIINGIIATVLFDLWLLMQKFMGRRILNFALLGRWIGHFKNFKFFHTKVSDAPKVPFEFIVGLIGHYAIGIFIAELLLLFANQQWFLKPDIYVALAVGAATVAFPLLIMQPGMGGGVAFTRTAAPLKSCLNSLLNHIVFGFCLYIAAILSLMLD